MYSLLVTHFTTPVIGQKRHTIEILVNTAHVFVSYGLPIIGIPTHEMKTSRDCRCMKWRINSAYIKYIYLEV